MADSDHQTDERGGPNLREKGEERKKETKMNILRSDFREKAEERKKEFF